jgi:hypothetical protein
MVSQDAVRRSTRTICLYGERRIVIRPGIADAIDADAAARSFGPGAPVQSIVPVRPSNTSLADPLLSRSLSGLPFSFFILTIAMPFHCTPFRAEGQGRLNTLNHRKERNNPGLYR